MHTRKLEQCMAISALIQHSSAHRQQSCRRAELSAAVPTLLQLPKACPILVSLAARRLGGRLTHVLERERGMVITFMCPCVCVCAKICRTLSRSRACRSVVAAAAAHCAERAAWPWRRGGIGASYTLGKAIGQTLQIKTQKSYSLILLNLNLGRF